MIRLKIITTYPADFTAAITQEPPTLSQNNTWFLDTHSYPQTTRKTHAQATHNTRTTHPVQQTYHTTTKSFIQQKNTMKQRARSLTHGSGTGRDTAPSNTTAKRTLTSSTAHSHNALHLPPHPASTPCTSTYPPCTPFALHSPT